MSFELEVRDRLKAKLLLSAGGNNASGATIASLNEMAEDVAHAVANDIQLALVSELNSVTAANDELLSAMSAFMTAFAGWTVVPADGGAALKLICAPLATTVSTKAAALTAANTQLKSKAAEYGG